MEIQLEPLPTELRDQTIGQYMDAFSRLENHIDRFIQTLLGTDWEAARALSSVIYSQQRIKLLEALASVRLNADLAKRVAKQCARLSSRNMRRNHIVHGTWTQNVVVYDDRYEMEWVRIYVPSDPALAAIHDPFDPKLLGTYTFTLPALSRATDHVEEMFSVLSPLLKEIRELIPQPPVHEAGTEKRERDQQ